MGILGMLSVFGMPTLLIATYMRLRHREKMRALDAQASANQVVQLEAARRDLEARVRTLETIVTAGDHDLEARLRRLSAQAEAASDRGRLLPPPTRDPES
jgi:type II secretory pathway pseudopilin PulG